MRREAYLCTVPQDKKSHEWFEDWFNSPYYHLLYSNRDEQEATAFIDRLVEFLELPKGARILDLACGKGRHSIALHRKGFDVTGVDLSPESIREAKRFETDGLAFFEHDMRRPFMIHYFDGVFNLFTSFGYFSNLRDNCHVVDSVCKGLRNDGIFVIDFFNAAVVEKEIGNCYSGERKVENICFHWQKQVRDRIIYKKITVDDAGQQFVFSESVQLLRLSDFRLLLKDHFEIEQLFGDYSLAPFDENSSPRLIIVARKR